MLFIQQLPLGLRQFEGNIEVSPTCYSLNHICHLLLLGNQVIWNPLSPPSLLVGCGLAFKDYSADTYSLVLC